MYSNKGICKFLSMLTAPKIPIIQTGRPEGMRNILNSSSFFHSYQLNRFDTCLSSSKRHELKVIMHVPVF